MRLSLPTLCAICHGWAAQRVCADCWARHAAAAPRCPRCGLRSPLPDRPCGACQRAPPPFTHTVAAVDYGFPWDGLLAAFKYHRGLDRSAALADAIVRAVRASPAPRPTLLLPVPLGAARLRERGYQQAWLLARHVGRALAIEATPHALRRLVDDDRPAQAQLGRAARLASLRGVFGVEPACAAALHGRAVALVDDVMTTGATATECTRVLLQAGAASVQVWVFARTPDERPAGGA